MKILITGGAGFTGSHLSLSLKKRGHKITVLDILSPQIHGEDPESSPLFLSIKDEVKCIIGDVRNKTLLTNLIKDIDIIVHLASETGTGQSMYDIEKYVGVNVMGTSCMLDILVNTPNPVFKIVLASSRAVYGEGKYSCKNHDVIYPDFRLESDMTKKDFDVKCPICKEKTECLPTDEDSKIKPASIYAVTKYTQEQMITLIGKSTNITSTILRYQNVYGPGQSLKNPYTGMLSVFSTALKQNKKINIFEDGKESRDFVYIDDVINATILAIEDESRVSDIFNVGSGERKSVYEIAKILKEKYKSNSEIEISGNFRIGDIRHNYADIAKIKKLGFEPKISFDTGIENYITWVDKQEIQDNNYEKSLKEMADRSLFK